MMTEEKSATNECRCLNVFFLFFFFAEYEMCFLSLIYISIRTEKCYVTNQRLRILENILSNLKVFCSSNSNN